MITIHPATPQMAPVASELIHLTMGKMADYLFGVTSALSARQLLQRLFRAGSNRFSYLHTRVALQSAAAAGLLIAYPGRMLRSLELPMIAQLLRFTGADGFARFIVRALPLSGVKETEDAHYFISNIAVLPAYQGQGIGSQLLHDAEQTARAQGFAEIALTVDVDNARALALYERTGYRIVDTMQSAALAKRIGFHGFHRMVKPLTAQPRNSNPYSVA